MEKQIDLTLNEKKYEKMGFEGLNQRVMDLNKFIIDLRSENKELQAKIEEAKRVIRDTAAKKDQESHEKVEAVKSQMKEEKRLLKD